MDLEVCRGGKHSLENCYQFEVWDQGRRLVFKASRGNVGIGLWKGISSVVVNLKQNCIFELREGNRIRFEEDTWCGELPLCVTFPTLYNVAGTRKAMVDEV